MFVTYYTRSLRFAWERKDLALLTRIFFSHIENSYLSLVGFYDWKTKSSRGNMNLSTEATVAVLAMGTMLPVGSLLAWRYCRTRRQRLGVGTFI